MKRGAQPNVAAGLVPARRVKRGEASQSDARGHKDPGYRR